MCSWFLGRLPWLPCITLEWPTRLGSNQLGWSTRREELESMNRYRYPQVMTNIAIGNGPVEIVSFPIKNYHVPQLCTHLPEDDWIFEFRALLKALQSFRASKRKQKTIRHENLRSATFADPQGLCIAWPLLTIISNHYIYIYIYI